MRRIIKRDPADPDVKKTVLYGGATKKMEDFLIRYQMRYQVIDTTNLNETEVVEVMIKPLTPLLETKP
jgi:hypothetical protein